MGGGGIPLALGVRGGDTRGHHEDGGAAGDEQGAAQGSQGRRGGLGRGLAQDGHGSLSSPSEEVRVALSCVALPLLEGRRGGARQCYAGVCNSWGAARG